MALFQVMLPPGAQHSDEKGAKEMVLDDDECPLQIFREWPSDRGECSGHAPAEPLAQSLAVGEPLEGLAELPKGYLWGGVLCPPWSLCSRPRSAARVQTWNRWFPSSRRVLS